MLIIEKRKKTFVNTDPQRRCYNGCHFSGEYQWTKWDWLELNVHPDQAEDRLKFWRDLSDYAVSQRGEGAASEYRLVERDEP